jgi:hypothetical protein
MTTIRRKMRKLLVAEHATAAGGLGTISPDCYAKRHVKGYYLDD